jgi:hypothetical protein
LDFNGLHALFSSLFFNPEDGGNMLLQIAGWISTDYMPYFPEEATLYNYCCENLRSCISSMCIKNRVLYPSVRVGLQVHQYPWQYAPIYKSN